MPANWLANFAKTSKYTFLWNENLHPDLLCLYPSMKRISFVLEL